MNNKMSIRLSDEQVKLWEDAKREIILQRNKYQANLEKFPNEKAPAHKASQQELAKVNNEVHEKIAEILELHSAEGNKAYADQSHEVILEMESLRKQAEKQGHKLTDRELIKNFTQSNYPESVVQYLHTNNVPKQTHSVYFARASFPEDVTVDKGIIQKLEQLGYNEDIFRGKSFYTYASRRLAALRNEQNIETRSKEPEFASKYNQEISRLNSISQKIKDIENLGDYKYLKKNSHIVNPRRFDEFHQQVSELSQEARKIRENIFTQEIKEQKTLLKIIRYRKQFEDVLVKLRNDLNRLGLNIETPNSIKSVNQLLKSYIKIHGETQSTGAMNEAIKKAQTKLQELSSKQKNEDSNATSVMEPTGTLPINSTRKTNVVKTQTGSANRPIDNVTEIRKFIQNVGNTIKKAIGGELNEKYDVYNPKTNKLAGLDPEDFLLGEKEFRNKLKGGKILDQDGIFMDETAEQIHDKYIMAIYNDPKLANPRKIALQTEKSAANI